MKNFHLKEHHTTVKQEILAGIVGFFTVVYIIVVNTFFLEEAGIPYEGAVIATILTSFIGSLIMGIWANAPVIIVPEMGINALFTYTFVHSMGFTWQEALAIVFVSGILFVVIAFTSLVNMLTEAIPQALKDAITVGLGLFLMLIGLEKGGLVISGEKAIMMMGDLHNKQVMATVITFFIGIILFVRRVKGHFLLTILIGSIIAAQLGILPDVEQTSFTMEPYKEVFAGFSFTRFMTLPFWIAVFSITMVIVFESIGLSYHHTSLLKQPHKYKKVLQATSFSAMLSGIFGSSTTVSALESSAAIESGGRTGLTAVTTGMLFLLSLFFIPYVQLIPPNTIAPILMIIGGTMVLNIRLIELRDMTEALPAICTIAMIPFTYSIADGMAVGFILYPVLKLATGKGKELPLLLYVISALFLLYLLLRSL